MTAGRLAASKPGATTNTVLYRTPITKSASTVLNACNQSGSGVSYRTALRDYEQVLHLDGLNTSAYKFAQGNPISGYKLTLNPGFQDSAAMLRLHVLPRVVHSLVLIFTLGMSG